MAVLVALVQTPVFPPTVCNDFDDAEKKIKVFEAALLAVSDNVTKFLAAQETAQQCLASAIKVRQARIFCNLRYYCNKTSSLSRKTRKAARLVLPLN